MSESPQQLYKDGQLSAAVAALNESLKKSPNDSNNRGFLAEMLCFQRNSERADKMLDLLGEQDSQTMVGIAVFRQLLRADQARHQFFTEGRAPEILDGDYDQLKPYLEASVAVREGRKSEAAEILAQAEEKRVALKGKCNGEPFDDLRDLDDSVAEVLEVLTNTGKYFWVPFTRLESLILHPPLKPRDLIWRRATIEVQSGPTGEVYIPAIYPASEGENELHLLGRQTDWMGGENAPMHGQGQRMLLVGDNALELMEISELEIEAVE